MALNRILELPGFSIRSPARDGTSSPIGRRRMPRNGLAASARTLVGFYTMTCTYCTKSFYAIVFSLTHALKLNEEQEQRPRTARPWISEASDKGSKISALSEGWLWFPPSGLPFICYRLPPVAFFLLDPCRRHLSRAPGHCLDVSTS